MWRERRGATAPVVEPATHELSEREVRLLQIIQEYVAAFDPARVDETLAPYTEDAVVVEEADFKPDPQTYQGRERCRDYWKSWVRMWEATDRAPEEFRVDGDRVAVTFRFWARARRSHAEAEGRIGMVYTFSPGTELVCRHQLFGDPDAALAAVSVPSSA